ncbi:MAG: PAS domain S-box protein [Deltaproteobacteria bacterium]|nr:PAS domain S-box protein [Deltaproteobacteria bacterium]
MRMRFQRYFKTIAIVFILSITGLSALLYHIYNEAESLVKEQFNEQQMLVARQTAIGIEENIRSLVRELELLSRMSPIRNMNPEKARKIMEQVFEYVEPLYVNDIALIDAKGINRLPLMAPHLEGKDFSYREYFKEASTLKESTPTYQIITFRGVDIGEQGIIIAMPIFSGDDEFGGVIVFTIKVNELVEGVAPVQATSSKFWAIDRHGNVVYHAGIKSGTNIDTMPNLDISFKTFLENIKIGRAHKAEYVSREGIKTVSASYPLKIADQTWSFVIATPEKSVSKLLTSFSAQYGVVSLVVLLFLAGASFSIIYLISSWNQELASTVQIKTEKLALSRERLRGLVETVNDLIWEVDENGKYVYVSPRVKDLLGHEPDQLIGKPLFNSMPENEAPKAMAAFQELAAKKESFNSLENVNLHKDGRLITLETSGTPILDVAGYLTGYRGVDRDITDRKRAEAALLESEEETRNTSMELAIGLSEAFEALERISSGDPEVRVSETSKVELIAKLKHMVNMTAENLAEIVDLSHEFAMGLAEHFDVLHRVSQGSLGARVSGTSQVELLEYLKKVTNDMIESVSREMTERKRAEEELRKHRDNLEDLVKERTAELVTANEQLQLEIVERKQVEEALRESERNYRSIIENMIDIYYRADLEGTVLLVSPSAVGLLGYDSIDELIGKNVARDFYYLPDEREVFLNGLRTEGKVIGYEVTLKRKDGTPVVGETNSHFAFDKSGKPIAVEGIFRDVTMRKQAEQERERLISELQDALAEVKALSGLLPICSSCKNIRDDKGYWNQIEAYIKAHSEAEFSHSICPACAKKLYPEFWEKKNKDKN